MYAATRAHPADPRALQPGDLLFYGTSDTALHHVALYLGRSKTYIIASVVIAGFTALVALATLVVAIATLMAH